jgi:hypothetical protein
MAGRKLSCFSAKVGMQAKSATEILSDVFQFAARYCKRYQNSRPIAQQRLLIELP